jgi:hypothetical protein
LCDVLGQPCEELVKVMLLEVMWVFASFYIVVLDFFV